MLNRFSGHRLRMLLAAIALGGLAAAPWAALADRPPIAPEEGLPTIAWERA